MNEKLANSKKAPLTERMFIRRDVQEDHDIKTLKTNTQLRTITETV